MNQYKTLELPSQEELRELFDFNFETGELIKKKTGKRVSTIRDGYIRTSVGKKIYQAHRLIWKLVYGTIPSDMQIDHIDGNRTNNKINNLRLVTNRDNVINQDFSGRGEVNYIGVNKDRGKYMARIRTENGRIFLGRFETPELAALAYNEAAKCHHGKYARLNEVQQ